MDKPLEDHILIRFLMLSSLSFKFFSLSSFYIIRITNSEGFYWLVRHSDSKRFRFILFSQPNPPTLRFWQSVLRAEKSLKKSNDSYNCSAELMLDSTAVVSSWYCKIFVSSFSILQFLLTQRDVVVVHFAGLLTKHLPTQPFLPESQ